jgi:F0F1-type ATP synthase alpha subunit
MRVTAMDLLEDIRTKKELTDEISDKLKSVVDGYAKSFA